MLRKFTVEKDSLEIEVCHALPEQQTVITLQVNIGVNAEDAIKSSGILLRHPAIDLKINKIGIFGKLCELNHVLREGDRVEIYRPLIADPKEARRQRAANAARK